MSEMTLRLTARDPIIARDGRPFGAGQGNRMRGLAWPLPSVVAGSFRTALVKAHPQLDFSGEMPRRLMQVEVAGIFPAVKSTLYLPAPHDCVWHGETGQLYAARPFSDAPGGCDFPIAGLRPVSHCQDAQTPDFKPKRVPEWWPVEKLGDWLLEKPVIFDASFLNSPVQETRDHVCINADTGAASEGQIFSTSGLNITHLPRFGAEQSTRFYERFAEITLSARVAVNDVAFEHVKPLDIWHSLGGERRLVHWQSANTDRLWSCSETVETALAVADNVRMVLATPAIFEHGWRPGWLDKKTLTGKPLDDGPTLKLVGVSNTRWKAVSGWSLAPPRGPKPIRRMVPAGSVFFFEKIEGDGRALARNGWLQSISDGDQERRDGFGLAVWGIW